MKLYSINHNHHLSLIFSCFAIFLISTRAISVQHDSESPSGFPSSPPISSASSPDLDPTLSQPPGSSNIPTRQFSSPTGSPLNNYRDMFGQSNSNQQPESKSSTPESILDSAAGAELQKICSTTDYPELCMSSVTPFYSGKTDVLSVLEIAIMASTQHTQSVSALAIKMGSAPSTTEATASTFQDCKGDYDDALDYLKKATDSIPARDTGTINSMLSAVVAAYTNCDDEFIGENILSSHNARLTQLASNCLAIASLIK